MVTRVQIKGLKETQKRMEQVVKDINGAPMLNAVRTATLLVQRDAKINAPVDTGRLRASITPEVKSVFGVAVQGVVGSNVKYAPYQELGFRAHFVPADKYPEIRTWARRHNIPGANRKNFGGLFVSGKARKFLQDAFDKNKDRIVKLLGDGVAGIVRKANNQ